MSNITALQSNENAGSEVQVSYSQNPAVNQAIHDLLNLGFAPLPVAPAFPASEYPDARDPNRPMFNGKNPSYIDENGRPKTVPHSKYRAQLPSESELKKWFADPSVGIGTNGGAWLDFDLKQFKSIEQMDSTVQPIIETAEWVERTQSGGYRIPVALQEKPGFTNIGIGDVSHAGELLNGGGFVVLAPTNGANGQYQRLKFGQPLPVKNICELGIFKAGNPPTPGSEPPAPVPVPVPPRPVDVNLERLASKKVQVILKGRFGKDRSDDITKVAKELYGWENLARSEGIGIDSADSWIQHVAQLAEVENKLDRILKPIKRDSCEPGLAYGKGIEACRDRLRAMAELKKPTTERAQTDSSDIYLTSEDSPGSIAEQWLYSEDYIRISDSFYKWVGTHYEIQDERAERKRIRDLLNRCVKVVETQSGEMNVSRPYRGKAKVEDAYGWCLCSVRFAAPEEVNPPGVNLKNGVLQIQFGIDGKPRPVLLEHSPEMIYTYQPQVAYHPEADDTHCQRLLEAIGPAYRSAVLRVFASALDLESVRKKKGRVVRSLILSGSGANGKDSLREALTYIFGKVGITSSTIDDFHAYDQGRRFNLAGLVGSRINWASENRVGVNIDEIQSLKQVITGDPIVTEEKFKQGQEFIPRCIAIFSTNDRSINLTASLEAIASRYAIVPFTKTFVNNPKGPNEIKADSRFKYDLEWVKAEICPALLNVLIAEYQAIFEEGIDYTVFDQAMEDNRVEANHLYRFALDFGLEEDPDGQVSTVELWEKLQSWYVAEGILKIHENGREDWQDDVRAGDAWVKGSQQLKRRLQKIFPNIGTFRTNSGRGITGIRFVDAIEKGLNDCQSWDEYCRIAEYHGDDAIRQAWGKLDIEIQNRIAALQPRSTPAPEPENTPEPAQMDDLTADIAILEMAAESGDPETLEHFEKLDETRKGQIWASTSAEVRAKIKSMRGSKKHGTATESAAETTPHSS